MKLLISFCCCLFLAALTSLPAYAQEGWGNEGGGSETPVVDATGDNDANSDEPIVRDGIYDKRSMKERQVLSYDHIREADVFWQKRIWRVIDTRQKMNKFFSNPTEPLIGVLLDIIEKNPGEARIFMDDGFTQEISFDELNSQLGGVDTIEVIDPETYEMTTTIVSNEFDWTSVTKFRVKEDWVFDEETSSMVVRILSIGPVRDVIDDNGNVRGQQVMFYAYYPEFREHLGKTPAYTGKNDLEILSWDDILTMRYFDSYIMKESNSQDRRIEDYALGKDALLESERIKKEIFEKEHNLWSY